MAEIFQLKPQRITESQHQKSLFQWASNYWWSEFMLHVGNEELLFSGIKNPWPLINHRKAMGIKRGFPDVLILLPVQPYHGMALELKAYNKKPNKYQTEWLERLSAKGFYTAWSDELFTSIKHIKEYLGENLTGNN